MNKIIYTILFITCMCIVLVSCAKKIPDEIGIKPASFLQADEVDELLSQYTSEELIKLVNDALIEPVDRTFLIIDGSDNFIKKFSLNKKEQDIIGSWGFSGIIDRAGGGDGPGSSINFLPNRYFYIYITNSNELGCINNIVGYWKVEESKLMLQFVCRIKTVNSQTKDMNERYQIEYFDDYSYYAVFTVPEYKRFYLNTKPFDWTVIPERTRKFYEIKLNDSPRGRLLFDTLGVPPGDLRKESNLGNFLLNPQKTKAYLLHLVDVW